MSGDGLEDREQRSPFLTGRAWDILAFLAEVGIVALLFRVGPETGAVPRFVYSAMVLVSAGICLGTPLALKPLLTRRPISSGLNP